MRKTLMFVVMMCGAGTVNLAAAAEPVSFRWWENRLETRVWVDPRRVAKIEYPQGLPPGAKLNARVTLLPVKNPRFRKSLAKGLVPKALAGHHLVFRRAIRTGSAMVLSGNIVLRFDQAIDGARWIEQHGSSVHEKVTYEPNTYIASTPPGLASLTQANNWRRERGVRSAEPVWWLESSRR